MSRLAIVMMTLLVLSLLSGGNLQAAEKYPVKPIVYIVPVEAGAGGDITSRGLMRKAAALLGQPVVILNKPGGGSSIGYREIHDSKPDGYTIGWAAPTILTNKMQGILPYDYNDFSVLGIYANFVPIIVASTKTQRPFKTIEEVIAYAKAHPGELSIATGGVGQNWWIATMGFLEGTRLKLNVIPQPGADAYILAAVAGGHTDLGMLGLHAAKPQMEAGNVRFVAYYGPKRAPGYEHVPTLKDVGFDMSWEGGGHVVIGPPKIPKDIFDKLAQTVKELAIDPEFQNFVTERSGIAFYLSPEEAIQFLDKQRTIYRSVMEKTGILKEK